MIDSQKEAEEILDNASEEATLGLIGEAVDHIDETIKEKMRKIRIRRMQTRKRIRGLIQKLDKETQSSLLKE